MKRTLVGLCVCVFAVLPAVAQSESFGEFESAHYRVRSELGRSHAEETAVKLEALMELFNSYFLFAPEELPAKLRVRIFRDKSAYDQYLRRIIDGTRDDFVYLHYTDIARSELVGYSTDDEQFDVSLAHQGFIQFLRAFIPNPPLWIREGFAVFFEKSMYDPELDAAVYRENLAWLDTLRAIVDGSAGLTPLAFDEVVGIDVESARNNVEVFYPTAWGMVSFMVNSENRRNNRLLWDAISSLRADASMSANVDSINRNVFRWVDHDAVIDEFVEYVNERRSFRGLVEDGMRLYDDERFDEAEDAFVRALNLDEDNHIPYYYLGLINYARGSFGLAEFYYQTALDKGAADELTLFALGVNAYADNRFAEAATYLERTASADAPFAETARDILRRIE
ncbi:MAG: hypothetical protein EA426_05865 [Spirochaetaceae bacterium]|nr:MAG: hypothetical protein EA426_05865 [Spirochaetaceae bacterium]